MKLFITGSRSSQASDCCRPSGGLPPAEEEDHAEREGPGDEWSGIEQKVGAGDQQAGGEGELAAERVEDRLQFGQQIKQEKEPEAGAHAADQGRVGEGGEKLLPQIALLGEVLDEPDEHLAEIAGGFAGGDEVDGLPVKHRRVVRQGEREGAAFAEPGPQCGAEKFQPGLLQTQGEEPHGFAGGQPGPDEVHEGFKKRQALLCRQGLGGSRSFRANRGGAGGRAGLVEPHDLQAAGLQQVQRLASRQGVEGAVRGGRGTGGTGAVIIAGH